MASASKGQAGSISRQGQAGASPTRLLCRVRVSWLVGSCCCAALQRGMVSCYVCPVLPCRYACVPAVLYPWLGGVAFASSSVAWTPASLLARFAAARQGRVVCWCCHLTRCSSWKGTGRDKTQARAVACLIGRIGTDRRPGVRGDSLQGDWRVSRRGSECGMSS